MKLLSAEFGTDIPVWGFVPGDTSFFDHPSRQIFFSDQAIDLFERTNDEIDLLGLVAHEYRHFWQFVSNINQDRPQVREVNARRFAEAWITKRFPARISELNFQPISPGMAILDVEPGLDFQLTAAEFADQFPEASLDERILLQETFKKRGTRLSTSLFIQFKLVNEGPNYSYGLWREFTDFANKFGVEVGSYHSFKGLFWVLNRLGFIEFLREEGSDFGERRRLYDITDQFRDSDAWKNPYKEYKTIFGRAT